MFRVAGSTEKFTAVGHMHDGDGGWYVFGLSMERENVRIKVNVNTVIWLNAAY